MIKPGRPREFDVEDALSKVMELFWENGYEATGLSDIIAATGLAKASLYSAFGNKQSMYIKALAHYEGLMVDAAVSILRSPDMPPLERVDSFLSTPINAVRDHADRRGCFLCNASADRASLDDDTAVLVRQGYDKMRRAILYSLTEAFPEMPAAPLKARAELVLTVYSGLRVMVRSGMEVETVDLAQKVVMDTLTQGPSGTGYHKK